MGGMWPNRTILQKRRRYLGKKMKRKKAACEKKSHPKCSSWCAAGSCAISVKIYLRRYPCYFDSFPFSRLFCFHTRVPFLFKHSQNKFLPARKNRSLPKTTRISVRLQTCDKAVQPSFEELQALNFNRAMQGSSCSI